MARIAALLAVLAHQREARITLMVKARVIPSHRTMTVAALVAATAIMRVVVRVAAEAGCWRIRKRVIGMTIETLGSLMLADQRIACRVVIELEVHPVVRRMAIAALGAEGLAMGVIGFVAGKTG